MKLSKSQHEKYRKALRGLRLNETDTWSFDEDIELGEGLIANVKGWQEVQGHDDNMWWVADYRDASAEVTLFSYNEEEDERTEIGYDKELTNEAINILKAA